MLPRTIDKLLTVTAQPNIVHQNDIVDINNHPIINLNTVESSQPTHFDQDRLYLRCSCYLVYRDQIHDLLINSPQSPIVKQPQNIRVDSQVDKETYQVITKVVGLQERLIISKANFAQLTAEAFKERKSLSQKLGDSDLRMRGHFIVRLTLFKRHETGVKQHAQLNFVELAGSEQTQDSEAHDTRAKNCIARGFNSLSSHLIKVALGKKVLYDESENPFINCLRPSLSHASNILLVNCVTPLSIMHGHTLASTKFCEKIRDTILKRLCKRKMRNADLIVPNPFET